MTRPTQQPIVLEPAFPSAVSHRNDVVRLPAWPRGAPGLPRRAVGHRGLRSRPRTVSLDHVESADLTNSFIAFLDLLTDVPGTAPDFPLVNAPVAAEGATGRRDEAVTPTTNRFAVGVAFGFPPLLGGDDTRATSAHAIGYRRE